MTDIAHLESIAAQLAARVREDDPEANLRWLRAQLGTDPQAPMSDEERLLFVIATAVPDNRPWRHLTAWTRGEDAEEQQAIRREALRQEDARLSYHGGRRRAA